MRCNQASSGFIQVASVCSSGFPTGSITQSASNSQSCSSGFHQLFHQFSSIYVRCSSYFQQVFAGLIRCSSVSFITFLLRFQSVAPSRSSGSSSGFHEVFHQMPSNFIVSSPVSWSGSSKGIRFHWFVHQVSHQVLHLGSWGLIRFSSFCSSGRPTGAIMWPPSLSSCSSVCSSGCQRISYQVLFGFIRFLLRVFNRSHCFLYVRFFSRLSIRLLVRSRRSS